MQQIEISALDFDLAMTLDSGQVFHWVKVGNGFVGLIGNRPIQVEQSGEVLKASGEVVEPDRLNQSSLRAIVSDYFALDHPLAEICASFPKDSAMNAARDFCRGLRIIRQPKWECLATFICSSMKQVAHIRQISARLRERFGEARTLAPEVEVGGGSTGRSTHRHVIYTFPTVERIAAASERELRECSLGYRAKNLLATARQIASGGTDLEQLAEVSDVDLRAQLCQLPGVGAKVANCVMLFAYERLRAFPIDVWIERVLRQRYFPRTRRLNAARLRTFTEEYFGYHGGYAQQYLFHHARKTGRRRAVGANSGTQRRVSPHDKAARLR
jgi:N-glycosylase/DNA lyase